MISLLPGLSHSVFTTTLWGKHLCYTLFTEEKPETQEGDMNLLTHIQLRKLILVPHGAKWRDRTWTQDWKHHGLRFWFHSKEASRLKLALGFIDSVTMMAQQVKNPPTMQETQETWVQSLGQEDPLVKGMATHSSQESHGQRSLAGYRHEVAKSWAQLSGCTQTLFPWT